MKFRWAIYLLLCGLILFIPLPKPAQPGVMPAQTRSEVCLCLVEPAPKPKPLTPPVPKAPKPKPPVKPPEPKKAPPKPLPVVEPLPPAEALEEVIEVPEEVAEAAVEEPAKEEPVEETVALEPVQPTVNVEALKADYFAQVREQIASKKRYPKKALRFHQEGDVRVCFHLDEQGRLLDYAIVEESRHVALNRSVEKLFESIGSFARPPEGIGFPLELTITINYTIKE